MNLKMGEALIRTFTNDLLLRVTLGIATQYVSKSVWSL